MRLVKIGIANTNPTVGAFESNTEELIAQAHQMSSEGCSIGCFPEQCIAGYPVEDLVQWRIFVERQWEQLKRFRDATNKDKAVFVLGLTVEYNGALYNCAAVVHHGHILGIVPKEKLPDYSVFDEPRTLSPGIAGKAVDLHGVPFGDVIFDLPFGKLAVEICEDIWSADGPMRRRSYSGAELVVNISASPWRAGVVDTRREMIATRAADNMVTLVYVNQYGGNDSLVFDGGGYVNSCGAMVHAAPRWREGISYMVADMDRTRRLRDESTTWRHDATEYLRGNKPVYLVGYPVRATLYRVNEPKASEYPVSQNNNFFIPEAERRDPQKEYFEDLINAMVTGLGNYFEKTGAFRRIGLALSGGKDSTLTLLIAYLYAQKRFAAMPDEDRFAEFITCFSLPTRYNSDTTRRLSRQLCEALGVSFKEVAVEAAVWEARRVLKGMLEDTEEVSDLTFQNMQARVRGAAMWNWSNETGALWLQTGNMSERAVGYTTIGGDLMGGYSVIGNLPKTVVVRLLQYLHKNYFPYDALGEVIASGASAELAESQSDEDELMPFEVLDACYYLFAGEKMAPKEVYNVLVVRWGQTYPRQQLKEWVVKFVKLFRANIFKWVQAPQTIHLGSLDLDRERALQLPVVQSLEWLALDELKDL